MHRKLLLVQYISVLRAGRVVRPLSSTGLGNTRLFAGNGGRGPLSLSHLSPFHSLLHQSILREVLAHNSDISRAIQS